MPPDFAPTDPVSSVALPAVPRVVLDSNVWIDILVFDDPHSRPIHAALQSGRIRAVTDARCLHELARVLDYPQFERFAIDKADAMATVAALASVWDDTAPPEASTVQPALPQCSDRDDQKFLELAASARAAWLVTKDKALLKLSRRLTRDFGCRIDRPSQFVSAVLG